MTKKPKNRWVSFSQKSVVIFGRSISSELFELLRGIRENRVFFFGLILKKLNVFFSENGNGSESFRFSNIGNVTGKKLINRLFCFFLKSDVTFCWSVFLKLFQLPGKFKINRVFFFGLIPKKLNGFLLKTVQSSKSFVFLEVEKLTTKKPKNQLFCFLSKKFNRFGLYFFSKLFKLIDEVWENLGFYFGIGYGDRAIW